MQSLLSVFTCLGLLFLMGCNTAADKNIMANFDKQGHRGCRGLMPENTVSAMLHAIDLGVTTLEMDVVITKDSQVILSHEPFFNHEISTQQNGDCIAESVEKTFNIYKMDYTDVVKFDVGKRKHPRFPQQEKIAAVKPTLQQVFDAVKAYCGKNGKTIPFFNIETKSTAETDTVYHPTPKVFVDLLMAVVAKNKLSDKVTIQSFDVRTLQYLNKTAPKQSTALLIDEGDDKNLENNLVKLGFTPSIYSPHFSHVTKELLTACKSKNLKVIPWTVNDAATIESLKALGVDGIITDYPNLFK